MSKTISIEVVRKALQEAKLDVKDVFAIHNGLPAPGVEDAVEYFYSLVLTWIWRYDE